MGCPEGTKKALQWKQVAQWPETNAGYRKWSFAIMLLLRNGSDGWQGIILHHQPGINFIYSFIFYGEMFKWIQC